ncbi:hypothetical protein Xkhy_03590 [Xanthomonas axonopodis pv. khayae]|nr:hypothetical protein WS7_12722 [Xanthomonas citri pv. malvacearum str. GSPB2388]OOX09686.1 hypothetical protein Xkhy_03590 [Xanthomonas axonopodis pv. khayae]
MPKGLISALWYYSRSIDAGATAPGAENALFLADSSVLVRDAHVPVRSTHPLRLCRARSALRST